MSEPKVPRTPPAPLIFQQQHFYDFAGPLVRIHKVTGSYALAWDRPRTYGPLDSARWDPHHQPRSDQPNLSVMYAADNYVTPFAEVFQHTRRIVLTPGLSLSVWTPTRPLRLLDLRGLWPIHNHASAALQSAPRPTCRAWAQAILAQGPRNLDGLIAASTMCPGNVVALWPHAADSFPPAPSFSRTLLDDATAGIVDSATRALRWPTLTG